MILGTAARPNPQFVKDAARNSRLWWGPMPRRQDRHRRLGQFRNSPVELGKRLRMPGWRRSCSRILTGTGSQGRECRRRPQPWPGRFPFPDRLGPVGSIAMSTPCWRRGRPVLRAWWSAGPFMTGGSIRPKPCGAPVNDLSWGIESLNLLPTGAVRSSSCSRLL